MYGEPLQNHEEVEKNGYLYAILMDEYDKCTNYYKSEVWKYGQKFYQIDYSNGTFRYMAEVKVKKKFRLVVDETFFDMDGNEIRQF